LALCESAATIARRRTMRRIVQGANWRRRPQKANPHFPFWEGRVFLRWTPAIASRPQRRCALRLDHRFQRKNPAAQVGHNCWEAL
jgi:hypothetical protein